MMVFANSIGIKDPDDIIDRTLSVAAEWTEYAKLSGVPERTAKVIDAVLMRLLVHLSVYRHS